ncbi:unnamed protein product [Staurois parvus]|uniref:Uncharacterized protein n=1 Tax=Staurois parvus TaxID=386267 RepID=A0ABN9AZW0_9NEOB|nr:unnamed protein product [Staurois parvus]
MSVVSDHFLQYVCVLSSLHISLQNSLQSLTVPCYIVTFTAYYLWPFGDVRDHI